MNTYRTKDDLHAISDLQQRLVLTPGLACLHEARACESLGGGVPGADPK